MTRPKPQEQPPQCPLGAANPEAMRARQAEAKGRDHLVPLDRDRPGFRDPAYRGRRDETTRSPASPYAYRDGDPVPGLVALADPI